MGKFLLITGFGVLLHAVYSAIQFRSYLKIVDETERPLPLDIQLQTLVAAVICVVGAVHFGASFVDASKPSEETIQKESYENRPGFATFNHRGRYL